MPWDCLTVKAELNSYSAGFQIFPIRFLKKPPVYPRIKTTLIFEKNDKEKVAPAKAYMMMKADKTSTLIGEINAPHLWGIGYENILPPMTDLCITDQYRKVLVSSFPLTEDLRRYLARDAKNSQGPDIRVH